MSLKGMLAVSVVLFIVLFVFATIGVFLFADVPDGGEIGYDANFRSFGRALFLTMRYVIIILNEKTKRNPIITCLTDPLLLFVSRMGTGENWDTVMHDVARATSDWSVIYFISAYTKFVLTSSNCSLFFF
jgi:hypothetical protein